MQTNEREVIIEHVLGDKKKENLEVALDIISMSQEIRERIIKTFLEKLKGFIHKKLDMSRWDFKQDLYDNPKRKRYKQFGVSKNNKINVILEDLSTDFSYLIIGVHSSKGPSIKRQDFNRNLNKALGKGVLNQAWIWYQSLKSSNWDYADWTNKDTLIDMHIETDRVVEDIGNHLLGIIEVAKPVIEEWVEQNPSAP